MKTKLNLLVLLGCVLLNHPAFTQDNPPAAVITNKPEPTATAAAPAAAPATNPAPAAPLADVSVPAPATPATPATNETPAVPTAPVTPATTNAAVATTNAAPVAPGGSGNSEILSSIQFLDTPLTAVIENLARQANLNYILDPKINFGQPGADGKVVAAPNISIRWENLTAQQALNAILKTYDMQIVEDPTSKIALISPKDPAAAEPLVTKVIQLKYANPSNIVAVVQSALLDKRSKVLPDIRTSQLVVVATEKEAIAVNELVVSLDTPTRQVLIEANLIETARNPNTRKGIDWSGTFKNQQLAFGNGILKGTVNNSPGPSTTTTLPGGRVITTPGSDPNLTGLSSTIGNIPGGFNWNTLQGLTPGVGFLNADGASAVLSFLNTDADAKVISTPRTITLDNEPAILSVTVSNPVVNTTASVAGVTSGSQQTTYVETGTKLSVTPRISASDLIRLAVEPTVAKNDGPLPTQPGGQDSYSFRKITTQVLIPSGNTLVMGGLVSEDINNAYSKVPIFGDLPLLGRAFRHETKDRKQKNLIIFITPTIVQDSDFQPTATDYLKTPLPKTDSASPKISAWDSGMPYDWSKPKSSSKK